MIDRRKNHRREDDQPKPLIASRTVLCSWLGILASVAGMFGDLMPCEMALSITMLASFLTFLFRLLATRLIG